MATFTTSHIDSWERIYRANFINSLTGFKSVSLVGSISEEGKHNLAIFSSIIHIGSNPPFVGFINRPISASPHTLSNIKSTKMYTINQVHSSFVKKAHQTSAKYDRSISEFEAVGLTPELRENIIAPFVKESSIKYALTLQDIIPIELNNTFLVIGKVISIFIEENIIAPDGFLHLEKAGTLCCNGADGYYSTELYGRYTYAKPDAETQKFS